MNNVFEAGDRVEYLGGPGPSWAVAVGDKGTVKDVTFLGNVDVRWDGDYYNSLHSPEYLKKVEEKPTLKVGDRVRYTGTFSPALKGKTGTVSDPRLWTDSIQVNWDDKGALPNGVFKSNVELVAPVVVQPAIKPAFSPGDRVKYTGKGAYTTPGLKGKTGTVEFKERDTSVFVKWDDPAAKPNGVYPANLEKIEIEVKAKPAFMEGDRVRFTGKHSALFFTDRRMGKLGTVQSSGTTVCVKWDGEGGQLAMHYRENLEKVEANTTVNNSSIWDYVGTTTDGVTATRKPAPVCTYVPDPDPVEVFREQADKAEEIADAYQELAEKLRDTADALEAITDLIDSNNN